MLVHIEISLQTALYWHIISFLGLGFFYELPEVVLSFVSLKVRDVGLLKRIIFIRLILTHAVGPFFGVMTVLSGFSLIYAANHSLLEGWLFWIIGLAAVFVAKGLFQHNVFLRRVYGMLIHNAPQEQIHKLLRNPKDFILNLLELPAYIIIFCADYFKPDWPVPAKEFWLYASNQLGHAVYVSILYFMVVFLAVYIICKLLHSPR